MPEIPRPFARILHTPLGTRVSNRLWQYALLIRLNRPIGIYLLLWPTLWALWIASEGRPDSKVLIVFCLGVVLMRSAGCAVNDYADRNIDPLVRRTQNRPVASGQVKPQEALTVFAVLSLLAFLLVMLMNALTIWLAVVGVLLAGSYPYMKRFHNLPQLHLGIAFGWSVPMAFAAQTDQFPPPIAWLLFLATVLWAMAYDTMYAMTDREDDVKIGVKSTAILFGESDRLIVGIIQTLLIFCLIIVGYLAELGIPYYLGLAVAASLAIYQQRLIAHREPDKCLRAFLNNHYFGMAIFGGIALHFVVSA